MQGISPIKYQEVTKRLLNLKNTSTMECDKCLKVKPASEFGKDKSRRGGIMKTCKDCLMLRMSPERRLKYGIRKKLAFKKDRGHYYYLLKMAKTPKGIARRTLRNAISNGHIIKPKICSSCGKEKLLHGHHKDYSKPLEVIWLCALCHARLHKEMKNEKN